MEAYMSLLDIGDKILSCSLNGGGHLTHSSKVSYVRKNILRKVDSAVFPRVQGGPLENIIAAK